LKRFSLPKTRRLRSNEQFKWVLAQNKRFSDGLLILYIAENNCGYSRAGVSVGKSFGKAVMRNRLKRLLREAFRQSRDELPPGFDYLLMFDRGWFERAAKESNVKKAVRDLAFEQVRNSFLLLANTAAGKNLQKPPKASGR